MGDSQRRSWLSLQAVLWTGFCLERRKAKCPHPPVTFRTPGTIADMLFPPKTKDTPLDQLIKKVALTSLKLLARHTGKWLKIFSLLSCQHPLKLTSSP